MPDNPLPVKLHRQDNKTFCGVACAQMVLRFKAATLLQQGEIDPVIKARNDPTQSGWATDPQGLAGALNDLGTAHSGAAWEKVAICNATSKEALARAIIWAIHHHQAPACVLLYHRLHWVLVVGYSISARGSTAPTEPTSLLDDGYDIVEFYLNDPSTSAQIGDLAPPHSDNDPCGLGGAGWGEAGRSMVYEDWIANVYSDASGRWANLFVGVAPGTALPPDARVLAAIDLEEDESDQEEPPPEEGKAKRPPRKGLIKRKTACRVALHVIESRPPQVKAWARFPRGIRAGTPNLVQRLDADDDYYFIVPIHAGKGAKAPVAAQVIVDARSGRYLQARYGPTAKTDLASGLEFNPARGIGRGGDRAEVRTIPTAGGGTITIRRGCVGRHPVLVWKPCLQSFSPFMPFRMAWVAERSVFTRIDGEVFPELTR